MPVITARVSPLEIHHYSFLQMNIVAVPGFSDDEMFASYSNDVVKIDISYKNNPDSGMWEFHFGVKAWPDDDSVPYKFEIMTYGEFRLPSGIIPEDKQEEFVCRNAPAILYGSIREALAQATAKGPYQQQILLPALYFTYHQEQTTV